MTSYKRNTVYDETSGFIQAKWSGGFLFIILFKKYDIQVKYAF